MKRTPLRRSPMLRRRVPLGQAARRRRQAGGLRVVGRSSVSLPEWEATRARVFVRDHGLCQAPGCDAYAVDRHHVIKRSAGGNDEDRNLVSVCRRDHDRMDTPYVVGRWVVRTVDGDGPHEDARGRYGFRWAWVVAADKWTARLEVETHPLFARHRSSSDGRTLVPSSGPDDRLS